MRGSALNGQSVPKGRIVVVRLMAGLPALERGRVKRTGAGLPAVSTAHSRSLNLDRAVIRLTPKVLSICSGTL